MPKNLKEEDSRTDKRERLRVEVFDPNHKDGRWKTIETRSLVVAWIDEDRESLKVMGNEDDSFYLEGMIGGLCEVMMLSKNPKDRVLGQSIIEFIKEHYSELSS